MSAWLSAVVVGLGTYLSRASFIVALADREVPPVAVRAMRNVAPAVLAALVASIAIGDRGPAGLAEPVVAIALGISGVVAARTRNLTATLAVGMLSFWLLRALLG